MLSYHNDPAIKIKYQERFEAHRMADEVIQGKGYENGRGCFVGCTLNEYKHNQFPIELGWPEWLAYLADRIFEGLPKEEAPQFGTDILDTVPVGINLEPVKNLFLLKVQKRNLARLCDNDEPYAKQCIAAIKQTIALLENKEASEAEAVAWSARSATAAAEAAAESARAAARAAEAASRSSRSARAAEAVAWSARSARAAEAVAWSARAASRSARSARAAEAAAEAAEAVAWSAEAASRSARAARAAEAVAWSAWSASRSARAAEAAAEAAEAVAWSARSATAAAEAASRSARAVAWSAWSAEAEIKLQRDELLTLIGECK